MPTNVISITDGQIFLQTDLFNANIRPAINAGLSVSRVGGAAQTKVIKKLGGGVRLALAQFRELAAFSQLSSDLDPATQKQLERGQRITEIMKQRQYAPLGVAKLALSLFAVDRGHLDDVPVHQVLAFESALHSHMERQHGALMARMDAEGCFDEAIEAVFVAALAEVKTTQAW